MQNTTKRAVIYCRVSTKEQVEEGNSLNTQEKICRDYALKNSYEIAEVFIEQGESAKTAHRTELQRLLNYCAFRKNQISVVIAYKIDRISRNTDDYSQIRLLLKRYGVEIKSTSEFFENTPAGRFMENIIANVAQFDNDVRTERSVGGMKAACREGRNIGSAPLGYTNSKVAGKSNIVLSEAAPLIKDLFERLATGLYSIDEVHNYITKQGLITRSGKRTTKSHFHKIIRSESYAGWIVKFGERNKGTYEPIISEALFNSVQYILRKRKRVLGEYKNEHPDFPLRRFVHDGNGHTLTGAWSKGRLKKYPYYRFNGFSHSFSKNVLENSYKNFVNTFSVKEKYHSKLNEVLEENLIRKEKDRNQKATALNSAITSLKEKQNQLIEKNLAGFISNAVLQQQLDVVEKEILDLTLQLSQSPIRSCDFKKLIALAITFLTNPGAIWENASFSQKMRLQWFNFPLGVIFDGKDFGTNKMCSLFKLKEIILNEMSYRVPSKEFPANNPNVPIQNNDNNYWDEIRDTLVELDKTLSLANAKPENADTAIQLYEDLHKSEVQQE